MTDSSCLGWHFYFVIHSSLYLRGFVLGGFANSLFRPENNNTLVGRCSGSGRQNCTTRRGLLGVPRDVQRAEYKEESTPRHSASAKTKKRNKIPNSKILSFLRGGVIKFFAVCRDEGLATWPRGKWGMTKLFYAVFNLYQCEVFFTL